MSAQYRLTCRPRSAATCTGHRRGSPAAIAIKFGAFGRRLMAQERGVCSCIQRPIGVCQETVRDLEEENSELRNVAGTFGQLAERLNAALPEERRQAAEDRRRIPRYYADRRQRGTSGARASARGRKHDPRVYRENQRWDEDVDWVQNHRADRALSRRGSRAVFRRLQPQPDFQSARNLPALAGSDFNAAVLVKSVKCARISRQY